MQATKKQVTMAAELYSMRDKARRLLGANYKPHMAAPLKNEEHHASKVHRS